MLPVPGVNYIGGFVLQAQGLFDSPPPLIQLPAPLFIGSTSIRGASTHFGGGDPPRWGDAAAGTALDGAGCLAVGAGGHQLQSGQPLELTPGPEPLV